MAAAGLNLEEFEKRQESDHEAAKRHRERQWGSLRLHGAQNAKYLERRMRKARVYRHRFEGGSGNPALTVFLCQAASAQGTWAKIFQGGDGTSVSSVEVVQTQLGENIMRVRAEAKSSGNNWSQLNLLLWQDFVWMSDRKGRLSTDAFVDIIGAYDIDLVGRCIGSSVSRLLVSLGLSVSQNIGGSTDMDWTAPEQVLLNIERSAGCVGVVDSGAATPYAPAELTMSGAGFPVQAGKPFLATVTLYMQLFGGKGGDTVFDLKSEPYFAFNVPCVSLSVET